MARAADVGIAPTQIDTMEQGQPENLVIGLLLLALGAHQAIRARAIRDWSLRWMQRSSYLILMRVIGILIALTGAVIAVAWRRLP